jgi:hypothetical protein
MILGKRKYYTIIAVKSFRFSRKSQLLDRKVTAVENTIRQNQENDTRPWISGYQKSNERNYMHTPRAESDKSTAMA